MRYDSFLYKVQMPNLQQQEFVLVCSQGTFQVPLGESRIGSDAACQICIRGDGVRPIHAYLRVEGDKLSIRSVDDGSSSATDKNLSAVVSIKGNPIEGPINLSSGQEVSIGNVVMRVLSSDSKAPSFWSRRWFKWIVGAAGVFAVLLLLAYCYVAFVVLDSAAIKERISKAVSTHFLRDKTEITTVQVKMFQGVIELTDVTIRDRHNFSSFAKPFIHIPSVRIKLNMWSFLNSGYRAFTDMDVVLENPEITIERSKTEGAWSIEDIIERYRRDGGKGGGLDALEGRLTVNSGRINIVDNYANIGETSLENIDLVLRQPPASASLVIERCTMASTSKPRPLKDGNLSLAGSVHLFDQAFNIDGNCITSDGLILSMEHFDLARLFEHFGYAWHPYRSGRTGSAEFKVVLGKPLNGNVTLILNGLQEVKVNGSISSDSLVSIHEEKRSPLGNIPMTLSWDVSLKDSGIGYVPQDLKLNLRGGSHNDPYLALNALGTLTPGGMRNYTADFECRMQDLLGTEVGKRLGLDGSMGGRLKGTSTVLREPSGALKMDAVMDSIEGYVNILDPIEQTKPVAQRKPPQRQILPLHFDFQANAKPNASGEISQIDIKSFKLSAPSFQAKTNSAVDGVIKLGDKLEAQAQFFLNLKGREFFAEFGPMLALFGFTHPIEEIFNLKVTVVTNAGREGVVSVAAEGTAARQWGPDDASVQLSSLLDYDTNVTPRGDATPPPYLSLGLRIASEKGLPLNVRLRASCVRTDVDETVVIGSINPETDPLLVNSDIATLRERFEPYIEAWFRSHDEALQIPPEKCWLPLYRDTHLSGIVEQGGRITLHRMLDSKAMVPDRLEFDLTFAGRDFKLDMPFEGAKGRRGQKDGRFDWSEVNPRLNLKGEYIQRLSSNKEEPHREKLTIKSMDVNGRLGCFTLALGELDLFKLANLSSLPNQAWTDVLASLKISGQILPPAADFFRGVGLLAQDDSVSGNLSLQIAFDREKDALELQKFVFKQDEQCPEFPLAVIDLNGSLLKVRDISSRIFPLKGGMPFSERLAAFLEDGGPAAMLDHLGDELSINQIQLETAPLLQWLEREQKLSPIDRIVPPLIASLRRRDWQPEGTWKARGVKLTRVGDPKKRSWKLVGAELRNDLSIFGAASKDTKDLKAIRPAIFQFSHHWNLQLGLSLSEDNSMGLVGDINLDDAFISVAFPRLKYEYRKHAKEPCRIEISEFAYAQGLLAQMGRLHLIGKPLELDIKDLKADWTGPAHGTYSVGNILLNGGPLPCVVLLHKYEPLTDLLNVSVSALELDLQWLAESLGLPPLINGHLKDIELKYEGSLIALQSVADPAGVAARFKLDSKDVRLEGLNPDRDRLNFEAVMRGVKLTAPISAEQTVFANLSGNLKLTTRDLSFKDLDAQFSTPADESGHVSKIIVSAPRLVVSSTDAHLNLLRAAQTPGIPLDINGAMECKNPLSFSTLKSVLHGVLGLLGSNAKTASAGAEERRFSVCEKIAVSGSLKVPILQTDKTDKPSLTNVEVQNFVLKNLKLSVPTLKAELLGGRISLTDADYDLSKGRTLLEEGRPVIKGIGLSQKFSWMDADLALLFDNRGNPQNYVLGGRLNVQHGSLKGSDFQGADRLSWEGAFKVQISALSVSGPAPQPRVKFENLAPWATSAGGSFGESFAARFRTAVTESTVNGRDIWPESASQSNRFQQATSLAIQAYLAKLIGFEKEKLEFQPVEPTVVIIKGSLSVEPFLLIGKGDCEGLDLWVKNLKVNLATETFNDDTGEGVTIYPASLPRSARALLHFDKWPSTVQTEYVRAITQGRLPLRICGQLANPVFKFPWADVRPYGLRALFEMDKIVDLESLTIARQNLLRLWGSLPAEIESAAAVADRLGVGLPGTTAARDLKESCIERVTGLPQSLLKLHSKSAPIISPAESLKQLLNPEPDPALVPGVNPKRNELRNNVEKDTR